MAISFLVLVLVPPHRTFSPEANSPMIILPPRAGQGKEGSHDHTQGVRSRLGRVPLVAGALESLTSQGWHRPIHGTCGSDDEPKRFFETSDVGGRASPPSSGLLVDLSFTFPLRFCSWAQSGDSCETGLAFFPF
ncbi:hypothetical protein F5X96DRAFT_688538 [Biscogniauxia mediterranea]|nr:hypothetical protein F5X96DRAFT_688538 [Biscogniauxia mediterranea]